MGMCYVILLAPPLKHLYPLWVILGKSYIKQIVIDGWNKQLDQRALKAASSLAVEQEAVPFRNAHTTEPVSVCLFSFPVGGGCRPTR